MPTTFERAPDGLVIAMIEDRPVLNAALRDAVSSAPPLGAVGQGPSTYWIDEAEAGVTRAAETGDQTPFASGDTTSCRLDGSDVVASCGPDEERIPLVDFLLVLSQWRDAVLLATGVSRCAQPAAYRRDGRS